MARPLSGITAKFVLNDKQLEDLEFLSGIGCTQIEMAAFFKCHPDTLRDNFSEVIDKGKETGKVSVRRLMFRQGEQGNNVALRYLIWNVLKEKIEESVDKSAGHNADEIMTKLNSISTDAILKLVKEHEKKAS